MSRIRTRRPGPLPAVAIDITIGLRADGTMPEPAIHHALGIEWQECGYPAAAPCLTCEACGRWIRDADRAVVVYEHIPSGRRPATVLCHQSRCSARPEYRDLSWMPLVPYLVNLIHNVGLHGERLDEAIAEAELVAGG
jgi:hypothetical protein